MPGIAPKSGQNVSILGLNGDPPLIQSHVVLNYNITQDNVSPLVAHFLSITMVWLDNDLNKKFLM
jgi:hypothetical protein